MVIVCTAGTALGPLAMILVGAAKGLIAGAIVGGVMGGALSALSGGSFLDGFEDGAFSGAISGAICGGLGAGGQLFGKTLECGRKLANAIKVTSKVTGVLSTGMDGFDLISMGIGLFDPNNSLVAFNQKLHSNKLYEAFQFAVNSAAIFTGSANANAACFIAGTMILTTTGLVAIENIKAGDTVVSTNVDTFETAHKTVLETYIREVSNLVYLTINGELIITTVNHPFYVKGHGFMVASELYVGDKLINSDGNVLLVESITIELTEEPTKVYNFQVEDFHTYYVGKNCVLVHNKCDRTGKQQRLKELMNDDKVSRSIRGELKNQMRQIKAGKYKNLKVPKGYTLAHPAGKPARFGNNYSVTKLNTVENHFRQHKFIGYKGKY